MITGLAAWVLTCGAIAIVAIPSAFLIWLVITDRRWKKRKEEDEFLTKLWNKFLDDHIVDGVYEVDVGYFWDCMRETVKVLRSDLYALSLQKECLA